MLRFRGPCSPAPTLCGASTITSPVGIPSETHHIQWRIPDSPPSRLIVCQPECSLAFVLSPPLQKNIEEEAASHDANRLKNQQRHDAKSS